MTLYRIRLRGSWEATPLDGDRVRHARRFGRPRTLDPGETAWLVGEPVPGPAMVSLNGEPLGPVEAGRPFAFEVTAKLAPRNEVAVELPADAPLGEVALEMRPA